MLLYMSVVAVRENAWQAVFAAIPSFGRGMDLTRQPSLQSTSSSSRAVYGSPRKCFIEAAENQKGSTSRLHSAGELGNYGD